MFLAQICYQSVSDRPTHRWQWWQLYKKPWQGRLARHQRQCKSCREVTPGSRNQSDSPQRRCWNHWAGIRDKYTTTQNHIYYVCLHCITWTLSNFQVNWLVVGVLSEHGYEHRIPWYMISHFHIFEVEVLGSSINGSHVKWITYQGRLVILSTRKN